MGLVLLGRELYRCKQYANTRSLQMVKKCERNENANERSMQVQGVRKCRGGGLTT